MLVFSVYILENPSQIFTNLFFFHAYLKSGTGRGESLWGVRRRYAVSVSMVLSRDCRRDQCCSKSVAPMYSVSLVRAKTFSAHVAFKFRHVVSKSGHFTHDMAFFSMPCVKNVLMLTESHIAWKRPSLKTMWQRSPGGGGTSGGMVAHDLVNGCQATA